MRAWGPSTGPTASALAGRRCSLWGWRKGVPGRGAFHHCEGHLRSGAVPPPTARPLGGLLGLVGCVRCVCCLCRACRGARCRSSLVPVVLPSPVSRCGVVLAVCLPCPLPCARPLLGRWLPLVPFVASLLFTLSSTLLPGMHFFPASALVRVSVFFLAGSSFSLVGPSPANLRRERMQRGVRWRGFCRPMAPRQCHPRSVSYSRGGVVCYLFMLRSCAPLSFFLPCCACYGVFFRASIGVGLYPTCSRLGAAHLFGRHLCSLSVPRARRDMQHTCFFPTILVCPSPLALPTCVWRGPA